METAKAEVEVDARQAARSAVTYFKRLFPELTKYSLEEIELSEDGKYWLITLGLEMPKGKNAWTVMEMVGPPTMKYKVFKVDARTGKVLAMKMRPVG